LEPYLEKILICLLYYWIVVYSGMDKIQWARGLFPFLSKSLAIKGETLKVQGHPKTVSS